MKKIILSFSLLTVVVTLMTGCNTISGMGKDVSSIGRGVSSGANAVDRSM